MVLLAAGPQLPPTATLHPPRRCGSTHLCSHMLSQLVGLIQLEARLPAKGRGLCPSQAGPAAQLMGQPRLGLCRCVWGACTCTLVPATCPSNKWVQVPSKPEQQDFASSLHYCKLLTCMTLEQRKVSPRKSTCVSHNPRTGCYEEKGSPKGRLSLRL